MRFKRSCCKMVQVSSHCYEVTSCVGEHDPNLDRPHNLFTTLWCNIRRLPYFFQRQLSASECSIWLLQKQNLMIFDQNKWSERLRSKKSRGRPEDFLWSRLHRIEPLIMVRWCNNILQEVTGYILNKNYWRLKSDWNLLVLCLHSLKFGFCAAT